MIQNTCINIPATSIHAELRLKDQLLIEHVGKRSHTQYTSLSQFTLNTINYIQKIFIDLFSHSIRPIDPHFTEKTSILRQRKAHHYSKKYLESSLRKINASVTFISPKQNPQSLVQASKVTLRQNLDQSVFSWENTSGVQGDIQKDGKIPGQIALYGVASQFNACESVIRVTPKPGTAVLTYKDDPTQGPGAQLQFPDEQVEIINNAANLGFNGLCEILNEQTKSSLRHGYLTPTTQKDADALIDQLQTKGNRIEFLCIGNIPKGTRNSQRVYEMLVAAPAFGMYSLGSIEESQRKEIEFLCALHSYRAQFQQAINLAKVNPEKQVIFKPTAPGLGVFGNRIENVAKGFYVAAKEHEKELKERKIKVQFQVFLGKGETKTMVNSLGLNLAGTRTSNSFLSYFFNYLQITPA